jgi:hypothetical protein
MSRSLAQDGLRPGPDPSLDHHLCHGRTLRCGLPVRGERQLKSDQSIPGLNDAGIGCRLPIVPWDSQAGTPPPWSVALVFENGTSYLKSLIIYLLINPDTRDDQVPIGIRRNDALLTEK